MATKSAARKVDARAGTATEGSAAIALLALVAVIALTAPLAGVQRAWADDATTAIRIDGATDGAYYAYKLLDGTFAEDDADGNAMGDASVREEVEGVLLALLSDYGYDLETDGRSDRAIANDVMDALVAVEEDENAQAFANDLAGALAGAGVEPTASAEAADGSVTLDGLDQGYYLVAQASTSDEAMTSALLVPLTSAGRTVTAKTTTPTVEKSVAGEDGAYATTADADVLVVGNALSLSSVSYRITGTVASNVADYETYYYAFVDKLPDALQVDDVDRIEWSVTVKLGAKTADVSGSFSCSVVDNVVTWETDDLLAAFAAAGFSGSLASAQVVLAYSVEPTSEELAAFCASTSTLADPQTNTARIVFSNNPYSGGEGSTSETPDDQTRVYSYNLVVLKVNESGEPLSGAEFTLTDEDGNEVGCNITVDDDGTFAFTGLKSGVEYTLTESSVPAGHKSIDPIRFTIAANVATDGETVESIDVTVVDDPSSATSFTVTDATVKVLVANLLGDDLPLTGLSGSAAGIAGGCALAACGCLVGIALRRMRTAR